MAKLLNPTLCQYLKTSLILVVDDDRGFRTLLQRILELEGLQVIEAEGGKQALEICQQLQPDIVLLDGLMPTMDGITCCQQLCALYGDRMAVVMLTQLDDSVSIDRAFAAGAIDYLVKPIHPSILRQKVMRILQQTALIQQLHQANQQLEHYTQFYNLALRERTAQFQTALRLEQTLDRVVDRVCDAWDDAQILQIAVQEIALVLDPIRCNAGLYDSEQMTSRVSSEYTTSLKTYKNRVLNMAELPEIYQSLMQGLSVQFCSLQLSILDGQTSLFAFPICYGKQIVGDLWLVYPADRVLDDLELRLVSQVTIQCGIGIQQSHKNQSFQAQIKELERLNRVKDDFLSTVSHELRSPVTNIRIAAQMLDRLATQAKVESGEVLIQNANFKRGLVYLQVVQTESDREIELINDLLDLQRLETGNQPVNLTFIYLESWILDLISPFQERAEQQRQTLQLQIDFNLPPIESNPNSLSRILTELLHNACKYTPPQECIQLSIQFDSMTHIFEIRITNTGVEIPELERERIFDKFYRIPTADRWKQGGTGLGLALVKRLVESLKGLIWVESSAGQTCFVVQLPLREIY
jgi:signal transduction histidine kinase